MIKIFFQRKFDFLTLCFIGVILISIFTWQYTYIARKDFYVAHHFGNLLPYIRNLSLILVATYLGLWLCLEKVKISPRTVLYTGIIVFVFILPIVLFTHPTRSQDVYWSLLLAKGYSTYGLNPYETQVDILSNDSWAYPVLTWKDFPMVYGPLWALPIIGITYLSHSLGLVLILTKALFIMVVSLAVYIFYRILYLADFPEEKRAKYTVFFLWNPFLIQAGLIDLHNDVFVLLAVLASYFFFLKKKYAISILTLVLGSLVKYTPAILILIPLYGLIISRKSIWNLFLKIILVGIASVSLAAVLYVPFGGIKSSNLESLIKQGNVSMLSEHLPGTSVLLHYFPIPLDKLRLLGILIAEILIILCIKRRKFLSAYVLPFLVIFFFATPWFQPWYFLWILPLIFILWPSIWIVLITAFLILTPELISPSIASLTLLAGVLSYLYLKFTFSRTSEAFP